MEKRVICLYEGKEKGPLLICIGGMHGNEPAGIQAIEEVFQLLNKEKKNNPDFLFKGAMLGLRGNLAALKTKQRFINRDLNRMLTPEVVSRIRQSGHDELSIEDRECEDLLKTIEAAKNKFNPPFILILDLHTTTADGGVFTIAADDKISRDLAIGLRAPVVLGIAEGLTGTTINYFNRPLANCFCIVFEAGKHDDPNGVHRSVAAIVNSLRIIESVGPDVIDHRHEGLLISQSVGLPRMTRLIYHYRITPGEQFAMNPGYKNFQKITAGEELAKNEQGSVMAHVDGMILMPKYQPQGEDGFFIVEAVGL